jgi:hypothetical protein
LGHVVVERLAELGDRAWSVFVFAVSEGDWVTEDFERVEVRDVDRLCGFFAFFAV